jgi:pyridoxine kinase
VRGLSWKDAARIAADYTSESIRLTIEDPKRNDYGVNFEEAIPYYLMRLNYR